MSWWGDVTAVAGRQPVLAAFTLTYLVAFLSVGVSVRSGVAVAYFLTVSVMTVAVARLERRFQLGPGVLWALSLWGLVHMAGGIVPLTGGRVLYNASLVPHLVRYDQAVHAYGFGYATVACGRVLRAGVAPPSGCPAVLAALAGMGVGAMNEVVEFLTTLVLAETNVGGFQNTGWDLVFNLLGATVAAFWLARSWRPRLAGVAQGTRCETGAVPQL